MIKQLIDIDILAPLAFLSSKKIIEKYLNIGFVDIQGMKEDLFLTQRELRHDLPDQIHDNLIKQFINKEETFSEHLIKAIRIIRKKYFFKDSQIKEEYYISWNNILTLVSPLLFNTFENSKISLSYSSLPIPNNEEIIDLTNEKLIEPHLHINGTSEMIYNWHYYLHHLEEAYKLSKLSFQSDPIFFKQNNIYNIKDLMDILRKSKNIFDYIFCDLPYNETDIKKWSTYLKSNLVSTKDLETKIIAKRKLFFKKTTINLEQNIIENEIKFYQKSFNIITKDPDYTKRRFYSYLLHYYILGQSFFNTFLIQQLTQYGFSQFQRITDSKLRDLYEERGFKDRFKQLDGTRNSNKLKYLEARFAPKHTILKTFKLYTDIVKDFKCYSPKKNNLSLTSHFIKLKEPLNPKYIYIRDSKTKIDLEKRYASICGLISILTPKYLPNIKNFTIKNSRLKKNNYRPSQYAYLKSKKISILNLDFFTSIDAAGNELYARPEAFAEKFRYLRNPKYNKYYLKNTFTRNIKITFHAGEDFVHLISGIRYIYEAIEYLNMLPKDRIGHATALGLNPKLWKQKLNNVIVMKQGEYLDDLFFLYFMIHKEQKYSLITKNIKKEYQIYCKNIYGKVFDIRNYKYFFINKWMNLNKAKENLTPNQFEIFAKYHSINYYKEYHRHVTISLNDIPDEIISFVQNKVLAILKNKNIAIESMITSNTRISFYDNFEEHHILSWLQNPNAPDIVLASDDPGLFNNNLFLEYFMLYHLLSKTNLDRKSIINKLLDNSEKYYFNPSNIHK